MGAQGKLLINNICLGSILTSFLIFFCLILGFDWDDGVNKCFLYIDVATNMRSECVMEAHEAIFKAVKTVVTPGLAWPGHDSS